MLKGLTNELFDAGNKNGRQNLVQLVPRLQGMLGKFIRNSTVNFKIIKLRVEVDVGSVAKW